MTEANNKGLDKLEMAAAGVSGAVIVAFTVFWIFQINSVVELLRLAYG
jgi:hypothetical protein